MGMYNDYYKRYYSTMEKQNTSKAYVPGGYKGTKDDTFSGGIKRFPIFLNIFVKGYSNILIAQCVITLILLGGLILWRAYPSTDLGKVYGNGLNYMSKGITKEDITKEKITAVFSQFKSVLDFNEKKEAYISENYMYPIVNENQSGYSVEDNKLLINAKEGADIRASYPGKVKAIGSNGVITVNYGEGIEMTYSGLGEVNAVEGMTLDTNDVLGKTGSEENNKIFIEIFYMGDKLNPINCFNLDKTI